MSEPDLMTRPEVAALCRTTVRTVERWAYAKSGPAYAKVGRNTLYRRTDVEQWIEDQFEAAA